MLTKKHAQLRDFIERYGREHPGQSPSFDEMREALALKSKSGIHRMLVAMEERGVVRRIKNRSRAIQIVAPNAAQSCCVDLPLMGRVS